MKFHAASLHSDLLFNSFVVYLLVLKHLHALVLHFTCAVCAPGTGLEFHVPSADASCLPPFRTEPLPAHPRAPIPDHAAGDVSGPRLIALCPAARPPTRAQTGEWLAAEDAGLGFKGGGIHGAPGSAGAGFHMDPNTGRLIPGHAGGGGGAQAEGADPNPHPSQGSPGTSLLETPPLGSARSMSQRRAPPTGPSRLRLASQPAAAADAGIEGGLTEEDEAVRCLKVACMFKKDRASVFMGCKA